MWTLLFIGCRCLNISPDKHCKCKWWKSRSTNDWSNTMLNYGMMMERYPNLKDEVGGSIPSCKISSLPDRKKSYRWSTASCALALACRPSVSKKRKERPMTHLSSKISTRFELASLTSLHIVNALSNLKNGLTYVLFVFFNINLHEIEGRHANAKAHDAIDHLASILSSREEIS